jgi:hypothetical protein
MSVDVTPVQERCAYVSKTLPAFGDSRRKVFAKIAPVGDFAVSSIRHAGCETIHGFDGFENTLRRESPSVVRP